MRIETGITLVMLVLAGVGTALPESRTTNPAGFTAVREVTRRGRTIPLASTYGELDNQSLVEIVFDENKMALPQKGSDGEGLRQVEIRVEAYLFKDGRQTPIAPIDNYVIPKAGGAAGKPASDDKVAVAYVFLDKPYDGEIYTIVPDTSLNLPAIGGSDADRIEIRITNLQTQETLQRILTPQPFGCRMKITDSLFFLKRLGVRSEDRKNGFDAVNFGPAPGVTYGTTYLSRGNAFSRFLQPGVGMNVSFMKWKDPSFDTAAGKYVPGASSSDVNVGMGVQFSLFSNVLQFTYGANLHVEQNRTYFGIGVSFVNLGAKIAGLAGK